VRPSCPGRGDLDSAPDRQRNLHIWSASTHSARGATFDGEGPLGVLPWESTDGKGAFGSRPLLSEVHCWLWRCPVASFCR
jgi:hypothetical protein